MGHYNIELVNHRSQEIAGVIWSIFQESYAAEAKLIGVDVFPPLERSVDAIQDSTTNFWCCQRDDHIVGIIEVEEGPNHLGICSLAVKPEFFRQGIAAALVSYVLPKAKAKEVIVSTAKLNTPATSLYKKLQFVEMDIWQTKEGIELVSLVKRNDH